MQFSKLKYLCVERLITECVERLITECETDFFCVLIYPGRNR